MRQYCVEFEITFYGSRIVNAVDEDDASDQIEGLSMCPEELSDQKSDCVPINVKKVNPTTREKR